MEPTIRYAKNGELPVHFHTRPEGVPHYSHFDIMKPLARGYKPDEIPENLDIPLYINYNMKTGEIEVRQIPLYIDSEDANDAEVNLLQLVLSVQVPRIDKGACINTMVDALKREKQKVMAESQRKISEIDNRIGELLAITYQPES